MNSYPLLKVSGRPARVPFDPKASKVDFRNMFSEGRRCEVCGKKNETLTEVTQRSIKENGTFRIKVCSDCLLEVMEVHFRNFKGRALVVDPSPKIGYSKPRAFLYSPVFHLKDANYPKSDLQTVFEKLPAEDAVCKSCTSNKAQYTWLPVDFLRPGRYDAENGRREAFRKDVSGQQLCAGCISTKFKETMKQYQRQFEVVEPPTGIADGLISLTYS